MYSLTIEDSNGQIAEQFSFDHGSYLIGRHEDCDIVLPSSSVSRRHANLFVEDGRCYIEDLNSANGVTVDGQRVVNQRHLGTASQVRVGDYYLYLEYQDSDQLDDQDVRKTLFISEDDDHHKLVRVGDEFAGEEFTLSEVDNTIGRTDDNFILLSDPSISRQHARVVRDEDYVLYDLGSSNGTRVNGEEVLEPTRLSPGDIVEFGNLEFAFVRGDEEVDPDQYQASSSSSTSPKNSPVLFAATITGVGLACLGIGAAVVFGLDLWEESDRASSEPKSESIQSEVRPALEKARTHLERNEWDRAIEAANEVLAAAPKHEEAKSVLDRAREEKRAQALYRDGLELSQAGKHRKALDVLQSIPEGTVAAERAEPTLKHVEKSVSYKLQNRAEELMDEGSREELQDAHDKLVRALSLTPEDQEARDMIDELEDRMSRRDIDYDSWDPSDTGSKDEREDDAP